MNGQINEQNAPTGSHEWLQALMLNRLHDVLQAVGSIKSSQDRFETQYLRLLDRQADHFNDRIADLVMNYSPRIEFIEARLNEQRPPQNASAAPPAPTSWAERLFGVVGVWVIERVPWKHVAYMAPGVIVAIAGHVAPAWVSAVLKGLFGLN